MKKKKCLPVLIGNFHRAKQNHNMGGKKDHLFYFTQQDHPRTIRSSERGEHSQTLKEKYPRVNNVFQKLGYPKDMSQGNGRMMSG